MADRRTLFKIFRILLRQAHVAFLVNVIIGQLIGNTSHGNSSLENVRVAEHQVLR